MATYWAHSAPKGGASQTQRDHLVTVGALAASFASVLGYADEAALAGQLHDCGKYGDLFQLRLEGKASHVDHWSAGAYLAFQAQAVAASLAIHGHHIGLSEYSSGFFRNLKEWVEGRRQSGDSKILSGPLDELAARLLADGFERKTLNPQERVIDGRPDGNVAIDQMLDIRFLY